jgi:hypothetical protein
VLIADTKRCTQITATDVPMTGFSASIQLIRHEAPKGCGFENLGSQGWLSGAPGWIHAFLETATLEGEPW